MGGGASVGVAARGPSSGHGMPHHGVFTNPFVRRLVASHLTNRTVDTVRPVVACVVVPMLLVVSIMRRSPDAGAAGFAVRS